MGEDRQVEGVRDGSAAGGGVCRSLRVVQLVQRTVVLHRPHADRAGAPRGPLARAAANALGAGRSVDCEMVRQAEATSCLRCGIHSRI